MNAEYVPLTQRRRAGQAATEWAVIGAVIIVALLVMAVYVRNALQGKWQDSFSSAGGAQFDPQVTSYVTQQIKRGSTESLIRTEHRSVPNAFGNQTGDMYYLMSYEAAGTASIPGAIEADDSRTALTETTVSRYTYEEGEDDLIRRIVSDP
jgi:Flp pilus assembly pilin Flp